MNVDKTFDTVVTTEMLSEFQEAGLREKVAIYFGQLEPASAACAAIAETCFDNVDFSEAVVDYYRLLLTHGFHIENLPRPTATHCMTHRVNAFLIERGCVMMFFCCWI